MAKTWVLDTETKGTGAHIAPLKRDGGAKSRTLNLVRFHPPAAEHGSRSAAAEESVPARALRFKVVDILAARVVAEDVTLSAALRALGSSRKAIDARVYVRRTEGGRWELLSLADTRRLWSLRERASS
jgi:hypothetical protein